MTDINTVHRAIGTIQTIPVDTGTAVGITTIANSILATKARITIVGDDIRYRYDGEAPTAGINGLGLYAGNYATFDLFGHTNLDQLRIIAVYGNATITVQIEAPE